MMVSPLSAELLQPAHLLLPPLYATHRLGIGYKVVTSDRNTVAGARRTYNPGQSTSYLERYTVPLSLLAELLLRQNMQARFSLSLPRLDCFPAAEVAAWLILGSLSGW